MTVGSKAEAIGADVMNVGLLERCLKATTKSEKGPTQFYQRIQQGPQSRFGFQDGKTEIGGLQIPVYSCADTDQHVPSHSFSNLRLERWEVAKRHAVEGSPAIAFHKRSRS